MLDEETDDDKADRESSPHARQGGRHIDPPPNKGIAV